MRILLGFLLLGHAVAHLPGFLVNLRWHSFPELPFRTTVLGGAVEVGQIGTTVVGLIWLALAIAFGALAGAVFLRAPLWPPFAHVAIGLSVVLCLLGWPEARLGLLANVVILIFIIFAEV